MGKSVAVVTGGASGIGAACARRLAADGFLVVVADLSEEAGVAIAEEIGGAFEPLDVSDVDMVEAAVQRIAQTHGAVAVLVNSAGIIQPPLTPSDLPMERWDAVLNVNLRGTYVACRAFARQMIQAGGGSIVNIASITGMRSMPLHAYGPSKAAVISMTESLAVEWGRQGVRVNAVSPGYTLTPAIAAAIDRGERDPARLEAVSALGRMVDPSEVAGAVRFLCSPDASAITAANIVVDCGAVAGISWGPYGGPTRSGS